jgi:hypothetical protein
MALVRRLFTRLRRARSRYGDEVLFAGWVTLPAPIRGIIPRR